MKKIKFIIVEVEGFEVGDIVKLKSGSPRMTVNSVTDDGDVWCKWFIGKFNRKEL